MESYPRTGKSQQGAEYINKNGVFIRFESDKKEEVLEAVKRGLFVKDYEVLRDEVKKPEPKVIKKSPKQTALPRQRKLSFSMSVQTGWTGFKTCRESF